MKIAMALLSISFPIMLKQDFGVEFKRWNKQVHVTSNANSISYDINFEIL